MNDLMCYKTLPEWDVNTLPKGFKAKHNTKVGTWAKLNVLSGQIQYDSLDEQGNVLEATVYNSQSDIPLIPPQAWHKITPLDDSLRCQLSFYCEAKDYYAKKYELSATHSEVLEVVKHLSSGTALDWGCGGGRNSLFLQQQGFDVTAFDKNPNAINTLQNIIAEEGIKNINAFVGDAHDIRFDKPFDLVVSTVVLMFLEGNKISDVIHNMQNNTQAGGYNLIVCAMDSEDYPMSAYELPFHFGFKVGELKDYYKTWDIKKYNEDVGHLHRLDANGNPIALRFATLVAQKPLSQ